MNHRAKAFYAKGQTLPGLWRIATEGGEEVEIISSLEAGHLESRPAKEAPGPAVSPDKGTILYTQLDSLSGDIMLVENFR